MLLTSAAVVSYILSAACLILDVSRMAKSCTADPKLPIVVTYVANNMDTLDCIYMALVTAGVSSLAV